MEEPDAYARSREGHVAAARLEGVDGAGGGGLAMPFAPQVGDGLGDGKMACGAQERRLSAAEEKEKEREREGGFALQSVESVETIPAPFEGRGQIGEEKGSSLQERPMDVDEQKRCSFPVESGESAESGNLRTCHVANGGLSNKTLCVTCGEAFCSKDVGCVRDTLDKATEGSQCEHECLAGNQGDWVGGTEVETSIEDLQMVCEEAQHDDEGLSNSMKHDSKRWPRGVDGVGFMTDANNDELKQDDLMPKIEAAVSRPVHEDSVPSVSGSIDVSLDGKAGRVGEISGDLVTCHVADGWVWNKGLCTPFGEGSQSKDAGCMYDTVDKATEGSQREQDSWAGGGDVLCDGLEVKTSLEDLQMFCKESHCDNEGLSDLVKFDIQWPPDCLDVMRLKKDANHELGKDGFLPKDGVEVSRPVHEDLVPSISGSHIVDSLDSKVGEIGEISEHRTAMEKVACGSQGGDMLSCESGFWKEAPGDENQRSRMKVKTSEEHVQTCWMEACRENGALPDSWKHDTEKLPCGADGLRLMTDANHELEKDVFLPNIDAEVSWSLDEASVPSIYENPTDVPLDGKADLVGKISEDRTCLEKSASDSLGGEMLSCEIGFRTEASGDENQHSTMAVSKGLTSSACKEANMESLKACDPYAEIEIPLQWTDQKYGTSEIPPERDPTSSSYNQPCEDEPCCSGRELSSLCLGHQDSAGVESGFSGHLAQELNACNCAVDKPCSVDLVKNGNDGELQNQKSAPLIVFRRRNPRRAASSRNPNLEKHDQINKASNSTRKSKKVESSSSLPQSTVIKFPNKTKKGRSGINRPLKYFVWGSRSLQKLTGSFGQNCGPSTSNSHLTCPEEGISDRRYDEKRQSSIRKSRSLRCSKNKCAAFSDIGYASDKLNGQPTFSVTTDTNASSEGHLGNIPKLAPHALVNVSDDAHKTAQCTEVSRTLKLTSIQTDRLRSDRGLENVTKETGPAYIHGECAISTSEPSPNNADVGFSPDSVLEVASVTCENNTSASHDVIVRESLSDSGALTGGGLHASALSTSDFGKNLASSAMDLEQRATTVRANENTGKEEISPSHAKFDNDIGEGKVQALEKSNTVRKSKNLGKQERQKKDGIKGKGMKNRSSTKISSSGVSKLRVSSTDSSSLDPSELLLCTGPPKVGSCFEAATHDAGMHEQDSTQGPSVTNNEKPLRRKKKDDHRGKKGKVRDPHLKGKSKKKNSADDSFLDCGSFSLPSQLATDRPASHMNEQSNLSPATELTFKNSAAIATELPRNVACKTDVASVPPLLRSAWVCCDDCQKWRCIPAELADIIGETNCRWTCKDNRDKAFAGCSIPQEKTNAEINAELELSDASADEADNDGSKSKASRAPSWIHVRSNLFLHRNRRTQSIDESMVCNCKPSQDGRMGCRDGCLNRMLNIECVKRTCPCGEHCSNQQFQRRSYAKLTWFQSGKKGYGLQLQEDVSEGRFLIEYVGEVLDITAYESRQGYYASKGQKHFYFMALNGGEVIDACTKGNLGRFINHSCSPNCRTEKWMVNGEVCIGIFAMRNIKKGEELTFDYNYVRVSGAAPQKCFCGTAKCRGYIGGDISGADIIAQDDVEAEHFEPMAVDKDVEEVLGANGSCSHGADADIVEHETSIRREDSNDCPSAIPELEPHQQTSGTVFDISEAENSLEALSPQDAEDIIRTPVHVSQTIDSSLQQFSVYGTQSPELLQKTPNTMDGSKAPNVMNGSAPSSDLGSNLAPGFHAKKNNVKHHRNVKPLSSPIDNEHILGVEGRLNNLLDGDGGISKRKDATNGYLKLLLVTAAEGDNAGGTSKSVRDLSLILDALLKTKSCSVLLDIISKNGLQMLHNILKQNRSNFHRIPIIRKLLKVLEFLASKGILTSEHINGGPRCAGMESFRDSMLNLTRHSDTQVHQIARNFRDRWIPRNIARSEPTEYPRASTSAQDIQGISAAGGPVSTSNCSTDWNFTRRKRKSRWDYQPDDHYKMAGLKIQKVCSGHRELDLQTGLMRNRLQGNWGTNSYHNDVPVMGSSTEGAGDEAPPGFESQQECLPAQASLDWGVAPGFSLERYLPNLSISYGIPVALVQHFGTPEVEGGQCRQKWKVAPGVPFNPFPPLPPYPRGCPCPSTLSTQMSQHDGTLAMKRNSSGYCGRTADRGGRVHKNWRNGQRTRWPYNYQGRRFPSNHHRFERC